MTLLLKLTLTTKTVILDQQELIFTQSLPPVLDSMGRPLVSGFAEGIQSDFGEYQQCLGIVSPNNEEREIRGKYCMMKAVMPFPPISSLSKVGDAPEGRIFSGLLEHYGLTQLATVRAFVEGLNLSNGTIYRMGICIPSQCSAHEFQHLLNACKCCLTLTNSKVRPIQCIGWEMKFIRGGFKWLVEAQGPEL